MLMTCDLNKVLHWLREQKLCHNCSKTLGCTSIHKWHFYKAMLLILLVFKLHYYNSGLTAMGEAVSPGKICIHIATYPNVIEY